MNNTGLPQVCRFNGENELVVLLDKLEFRPFSNEQVFASVPVSQYGGQNFLEESVTTNFNSVAAWSKACDGKKNILGDDTYLISSDGKCVGVFDGVGGNYEHGINPREYSYSLMTGCKQAVEELKLTDPLQILQNGFENASDVQGSSTANVIYFDNRKMELNSINVGDSQFFVLRQNDQRKFSIVAKSEPQYDPDVTWTPIPCPRQLGNSSVEDKPEIGDSYQIPILKGDIIILATDGLFDNLFDEEILAIVNNHFNEPIQQIARILVESAYKTSKDKTKVTPFSGTIGKLVGYHKGGKEDDITVVLTKILMRPLI